jgi:hypothetical protein
VQPPAIGEGSDPPSASPRDAGRARARAPRRAEQLQRDDRGRARHGRELVAARFTAAEPARRGSVRQDRGRPPRSRRLLALFESPTARRITLYSRGCRDLRDDALDALASSARPADGKDPPSDHAPAVAHAGGCEPPHLRSRERRGAAPRARGALAVVASISRRCASATKDVLVLGSHFLKEACREAGIPPKTFSRGALQLLRARCRARQRRGAEVALRAAGGSSSRAGSCSSTTCWQIRWMRGRRRGRSDETCARARERSERTTSRCRPAESRPGRGCGEAAGDQRTNLYRKLKQPNIPDLKKAVGSPRRIGNRTDVAFVIQEDALSGCLSGLYP